MKSIKETTKKVLSGNLKPTGLVQESINKIETKDKELNSFIFINRDGAMKEAEELEKRVASGDNDLPLAGLPIAIKDNICTQGLQTSCGSNILKNYIAPYDATVIKKLKEAGALIIGKTNMDEFAMGSSNEHSAYGPVKNPVDTSRTPGGSSGGSAAAVAADFCPAALGSDTGGSIRLPASFCGIVAIKPTYGRVSRYGLVAFASSLDQIGPLTKTAEDAAIMLNVICGRDENDTTSLNEPLPDFTADLNKGVKGLKIGLPKEYFASGLDPDVEKAVRDSATALEKEGAKLVDIDLPHTGYAVPTYYIIAPAEASANLARYDGIRYGLRDASANSLDEMYKKTRSGGFGPEVMLRIILGTYVLSSGYYDAYYNKALKVRTLIKNDFLTAFNNVDAILTPVAPTTAFKLGERSDDPLKMYLSDIFTIPCNLAGLPGISVPCGKDKDGLPIGMQLLGKPLDEATILRIANCYENL
jgi:aspartyl-tRNA(Asn)/glutamyl-tRNA(Gln) amidotransferase subunit A